MSEQGWIFIAGILVAVISYFSNNFIFDPLLEFNKIKGRIFNKLKYHSNIITNGKFPDEIIKPISKELRELSCDLEERYFAISFKFILLSLLIIPSRNEINEISQDLIFLSNSVGTSMIDENYKRQENIKRILRLR